MPTSELERLLRRLRSPVVWLPPLFAFAAAVTFGKAFGATGAALGIPFGLVLGFGLGVAWHWLTNVRGHDREQEFAERTLEEARRAPPYRTAQRPPAARVSTDPATRPSSPRDAHAVADRAYALLSEDRVGEACLEATQAIQMAVLTDDVDVALDVWSRFERHHDRLMLEPATEELLRSAPARERSEPRD